MMIIMPLSEGNLVFERLKVIRIQREFLGLPQANFHPSLKK